MLASRSASGTPLCRHASALEPLPHSEAPGHVKTGGGGQGHLRSLQNEVGVGPPREEDANARLPVIEKAAHGHRGVQGRAREEYALRQGGAQQRERVLAAHSDENEYLLVVLDHNAVDEGQTEDALACAVAACEFVWLAFGRGCCTGVSSRLQCRCMFKDQL